MTKTSDYERGNNEFVEDIDEMTLQGRTNEVHQACQAYLGTFWDPDNSSNFNQMLGRIDEMANEQPTNQVQFRLSSKPTP